MADYFTMQGDMLPDCGPWAHTHGGAAPPEHTHHGRIAATHHHCQAPDGYAFMEAIPSSAAEAAARMSVVLPVYNEVDFYEDMGRAMGDGDEDASGGGIRAWLPWIGLAVVGIMVFGAAGSANRPTSRRELL